jgi:aminopeptidase
MKRSLCQFPTQASAELAKMSLAEYSNFIFEACKLNDEKPSASWQKLSKHQSDIVDKLHSFSKIRYVNKDTDISFSTKGRTWINSDGKTNMPSGEVYTSPVEDSVNGHIFFDYPSRYFGKEVENVTLKVEKGIIKEWDAEIGKEVLDKVFEMEGTRVFGEAAIGTNYSIKQATNNILFDEKIGGTIHMAIGQSYPQAGGKNKSSVHWDLICGMQAGGKIFGDEELIYENGMFNL